MIKAWTIAYYLLLGLITFADYYLTIRWGGRLSGHQADLTLGCAFMVLVIAPLIIEIVRIAYRAMTAPSPHLVSSSNSVSVQARNRKLAQRPVQHANPCVHLDTRRN
jgi:hypothetical protein